MTRGTLTLLALTLLSACGGTEKEGGSTFQGQIKQLRVAIESKAVGECSADRKSWTPVQRDYVQHISARMEIPVLLCPVANKAQAAKALADGKVDMALLDPASIAPVKDSVRPIMTGRIPADIGRVAIVLVATENSPANDLAAARQARLALSGANTTMLAGVKRTLAAWNFSDSAIAAAQTLADAPDGLAVIKAGKADVLVLYGAEWTRLCRGEEKGDRPCEGLKEVWRGRPAAASAWSVRQDIPKESWARLLGIHIALPQEKPDLARWFIPDAAEIEPTEATALEQTAS
ncbi:PhnD/SsuA/transferrin family substrate-binding protein [Sphingorhabdus sp.]|jgi:ABC-type phosphate/phosphonate transport system substrate-binding protein|uniref:PhnD/SsuA/transferrin family substrate-binding protein n=1 Tax=Sphingorhabdus sp. TaxID=1902408 RepID=UPI0037C8D740